MTLAYLNVRIAHRWAPAALYILVAFWVGIVQLLVGARGYTWSPSSSFNIDPLMRLAPIQIRLRYRHLLEGLSRIAQLSIGVLPALALWVLLGGDERIAAHILLLVALIGIITLSFGFLGTSLATGHGAMTVSRTLTLFYIIPTILYFYASQPIPRWHAPTVLLAHVLYRAPVDWGWVLAGTLLPTAAFVLGSRIFFGARELEVRGVPLEHWLDDLWPARQKPTYRQRALRTELIALGALSALALLYLARPQLEIVSALVVVLGTVAVPASIIRRAPGFDTHAALLLLGTSGRSTLLFQHIRRSARAALVSTPPATLLVAHRLVTDKLAVVLPTALPVCFCLGFAAALWTNPVPARSFTWGSLALQLFKLTPPILVLAVITFVLHLRIVSPSVSTTDAELFLFGCFLVGAAATAASACLINVALRNRPG